MLSCYNNRILNWFGFRVITCLTAFLVMLGCDRFQGQAKFQVFSGETIGTYYIIKAKNSQNHDLHKKIERHLSTLAEELSHYDSNSEISLINSSPSGKWIRINKHSGHVIQTALRISKMTGGAFDISVSPLVNLWGFGENSKMPFPEPDAIRKILNVVGYQNLEIETTQTDSTNAQSYRIRKRYDGTRINLSAIAKGYIVDEISSLLTAEKIFHFMVDIGGEIRTSGLNADGNLWRIAIEKPRLNNIWQTIHRVINISDLAIATSGDYRNFFEHDGTIFSHTIDPFTGYPINHQTASVTVISKSCMEADALATALLVMGHEKGLQFAEKNNIYAYFLTRQRKPKSPIPVKPSNPVDDFVYKEFFSDNFDLLIKQSNQTIE